MSQLATLRVQAYFQDPTAPDQAVERGSRGPWVANVRRALRALQGATFQPDLSTEPTDEQLFDSHLEAAIQAFQGWQRHSSHDGVLGPGTRRLLARSIWAHAGPRFLTILERQRPDQRPRAFLSHASADAAVVDQVESYLHAHAICITRYTHSFLPGEPIVDEIEQAVALADKVIVFQSDRALESQWVAREIQLAEALEREIDRHLLIYVLLGVAQLDTERERRIVIRATGRPLRAVGDDLLRALYGPAGPPTRSYDPDSVL